MKSRIAACFAPNDVYSRHSEGAFLKLDDGEILFAYSRFTGSWNDDAHSEIAGCWSKDGGESWSAPVTLVSPEMYGVSNVMSVSLMKMENGDVGLFYSVKKTTCVNVIMLARSKDGGRSFYKYVECTKAIAEGYYVLNNDRVIRMSCGRLVMPLAFHRGGHSSEGGVRFDGRAYAVWLLSDDDGETWREGRETVFPTFTHTDTGLQEPGCTEMGGGLYGYFRTDQGVQYESWSMDGGDTWTVAQPSRFTSPASPMKIARDPFDGSLVAVYNPIPPYNGRAMAPAGWFRTPLAVQVSRDEGRTWTAPFIVEDDPDRGYCYPAVMFPDEKSMLLAYCSGGRGEAACLARLTIRKIELPL